MPNQPLTLPGVLDIDPHRLLRGLPVCRINLDFTVGFWYGRRSTPVICDSNFEFFPTALTEPYVFKGLGRCGRDTGHGTLKASELSLLGKPVRMRIYIYIYNTRKETRTKEMIEM